jgi:hypothetical protein
MNIIECAVILFIWTITAGQWLEVGNFKMKKNINNNTDETMSTAVMKQKFRKKCQYNNIDLHILVSHT